MTALPSRADVLHSALTTARELACVCDVHVTAVEKAAGLWRAQAKHDHWCPLLRAREHSTHHARGGQR
jgi:hypothetical protein